MLVLGGWGVKLKIAVVLLLLLVRQFWQMQKNDLARMYRLFQRIPKGLEPVAESFKKHVESEGMKLVKEATEAATAKKDKDAGKPSKDSGAAAAKHSSQS